MYAQLQGSKGILLLIAVSTFVTLFNFSAVYAQTCNASGRLIDGNGNDIGACSTTTTLTRGGVFGCTGRGATVSNVGLTAIQGGIYVPVNDSAVTLNTGYLVYKECVLDAVVKRAAENGTVQIVVQTTRSVTTGRDGRPQWVENELAEIRSQQANQATQILSNENLDGMCPAFQNNVRVGQIRTLMLYMNSPKEAYKCTMPTDPNASIWTKLSALRNPVNNSIGASIELSDQVQSTFGYLDANQRARWARNNGFYDQTSDLSDPLNATIITPGAVIAGSYQQVLGSGFRQLENANEIDQIVGNLFSGLQSQIIGGNGGIAGLLQSVGGAASYLSRMAADSAQGVRDQAINAAIAVLNGALSAERLYKSAKEAIANAIINAIGRLRAAETQCWALIVPKVQEKAAADGASLTIATSTAASQAIVTGQIAPIASSTSIDIRNSENALEALTTIATILVSSTNATAQQQALLQLEELLNAGRIHTQQDAQAAVSQRDSVLQALNVLVEDTITAWGDSTDPNIGWCNVNNEAVIERWYTAWRM